MRTKEIIVTKAQTGNSWLGIPGIERTHKGRLYVCWFSGGDKEPAPENRVYLQRSDDDGRSFTDPQVIVDPAGCARAFDPTLWVDPQARLWLIYNQSCPDRGEHGVYAVICDNPESDIPQWREPRRLGYGVPFSFRMNKPTVLRQGGWVMPVTWTRDEVAGWFQAGAELQGVGLSNDQGQTWELYGEVKAPQWALENMIMERTDGTLVMYIRAGGGVIWQSVSQDRGHTWSDGEPTTIVNPGTRFFIRPMPSGKWLLINTPHAAERTGMYAYLSDDQGLSWSNGLLLDEREQVSHRASP